MSSFEMAEPDRESALFGLNSIDVAAIEARQNQIIRLLKGVRGLAAAIVILFVVFGFAATLIVERMNDTRDTTKRLARDQRTVVCDGYARNGISPPHALECP